MNALWLERITAYKNSPLALDSARVIIAIKAEHQSVLLKKYKQEGLVGKGTVTDSNSLLLYEARAAKHFWQTYKKMLPNWTNFPGRRAHAKDATNILLDIGYHHLATKVAKILQTHNVTLAPALFHVAHKEKSAPLVYDLMEMFRSDLVDVEVLKFLRLKKLATQEINQGDISKLLARINKRLLNKYFLRDFGQCHTYEYYMELQIIKFIKAVNHKEVFRPLHLPARHETRCTCNTSVDVT